MEHVFRSDVNPMQSLSVGFWKFYRPSIFNIFVLKNAGNPIRRHFSLRYFISLWVFWLLRNLELFKLECEVILRRLLRDLKYFKDFAYLSYESSHLISFLLFIKTPDLSFFFRLSSTFYLLSIRWTFLFVFFRLGAISFISEDLCFC